MRFGYLCKAAAFAAVISNGPVALADPTPQPSSPATAVATAPAASSKRDVATLLFSTPQWGLAPAGSSITYDYSKKTAEPTLAPSFNDHITLHLGSGDGAESREADVRMFSGANAKPAGPFKSEEQNPVLLLVLEDNVQELSKSFKANPRYLKNAIRKAWRNHASIEPAQIDVDGKLVPGTRITIQPFVGDAEAGKMKGLDGMVYTVDIADSVPGNIAAIDIRAPADGAKFSETLRYATSRTP